MSSCGKVKNPCKICLNQVTNKTGLQCQGACKKWAHYNCLNYTPGKISDIKAGILKVMCPCPNCDTSAPKEFLTNPPYTCSNQQCPANKLPVCQSQDCPMVLSQQMLVTSQCLTSCPNVDDSNGKQSPCPEPQPPSYDQDACLPQPPCSPPPCMNQKPPPPSLSQVPRPAPCPPTCPAKRQQQACPPPPPPPCPPPPCPLPPACPPPSSARPPSRQQSACPPGKCDSRGPPQNRPLPASRQYTRNRPPPPQRQGLQTVCPPDPIRQPPPIRQQPASRPPTGNRQPFGNRNRPSQQDSRKACPPLCQPSRQRQREYPYNTTSPARSPSCSFQYSDTGDTGRYVHCKVSSSDSQVIGNKFDPMMSTLEDMCNTMTKLTVQMKDLMAKMVAI